uniref:Conserved oligomeric Golgi complex subunit 1 n=1 Tax=Gadus morhua TaxID=8049 RepID=A0A8C5A1A6_GADMO
MASLISKSLRVSEIKDPWVLFERYNTEEIRRIERKVRGEIEQKKEELRQMVGERYRDLIDAADTIGEMRQCSQSVVLSIQDMNHYCQKLKQGKPNRETIAKQETQLKCQGKFYNMAAQIRLLLEIPECIWSAMESLQYLKATQLYLLCCHLHGMLKLETATGPHCSPILARFPILVRQVATTGHFRSAILLHSRSLLRGRAVSDQAIAEALVSTMLLEDSSPRQALADFLLARKSSIYQLLNQPQQGAGIKAQVCSLVELLVTTLFQAYAVFYMPPEGGHRPGEGALTCGILFSTLEHVTSTVPAGKDKRILQEEMSTGSVFRYLPSSVSEFQPVLRTLARPIQREQLRDTLQQWITTCKEDICSGISSLLVYVTSLKALAAIRDAIWDLLSTDSISLHWGSVCQCLLERPLDVWEDFLQHLFLQRLQAITKDEMDTISDSSTQLLTSALRDLESPAPQAAAPPKGHGGRFESDVASFLWSEAPGDLLSDSAWVSVAQRDPQHHSGLAMKTLALTPCVQSFCTALDAKLRTRLDDLQHYLPVQEPGSSYPSPALQGTRPAKGLAASAFDRFKDAADVEQSLRDSCLACVQQILSHIRSELSSGEPRPDLGTVLFVARLCQSMGDLCTNLRRCVLGREGSSEAARETPRPGRKLGKAKAPAQVGPAQARWVGLRRDLGACSMDAYRIWSSALSQALVDHFATALNADTPGAILKTATSWEELEIQEEAESGSSVTSKIRLPVQPSWFVQALLFQLCLEVNRVGGHALPRPTLHELLKSCLDRVLHHYHSITQQTQDKDHGFPMTQTRALQLLFDLRYLCSTLSPRPEGGQGGGSSQDPRIQQVCDWLEGFIDPFDLDVFTAPLSAHLNRLSQRTSVLLGFLTDTEKQFVQRNSAASSQEQYNILPLASSQIRFGLLPLSMSNTRHTKAGRQAVDPVSRATPTNSAIDHSFRPGNLFRQLAHHEEEPAAPSLFKLSWLSGMAK